MMKTATIVHGWDGNPEEPILQSIRAELERNGYVVEVPSMPNPAEPGITEWVAKLKEVVRFGERTVLIGHSIGCQAILRYVEALDAGKEIDKVVLIAPWMELDMNTIREEGEEIVEIARPWMETPIDFGKVRSMVGKVVAIFSDNDSYVPLNQKDLFEKELGAKTIIEHDKGHFTISDGVRELPSVVEAALDVT